MPVLDHPIETESQEFGPLGRLTAGGFLPAQNREHLEVFAPQGPTRSDLERAARVQRHMDAARERLNRRRADRAAGPIVDAVLDHILKGRGNRSLAADLAKVSIETPVHPERNADVPIPEIVIVRAEVPAPAPRP